MTVAHPTRRVADPRPRVEGNRLAGVRCVACAHPSALVVPRCARCGAETDGASFGPEGVVWSATTLHASSGERAAPYTLAYVDLDDGPRLLAHLGAGGAPAALIAARVRLAGRTEHGDPHVELIG